MKRRVLSRMFFLLLLYSVVLVLLAMIQFSGHGGFTQRVGAFTVTGRYGTVEAGAPALSSGETLLSGAASIYYGGMEFCLGEVKGGGVLLLQGEDGSSREVLPERMRVSGDAAYFTLAGGSVLSFSVHLREGQPELEMYCVFAPGVAAVELPYKPLQTTTLQKDKDGRLFASYDGTSYGFGDSVLDSDRGVLLFEAAAPTLTYGIRPFEDEEEPAPVVEPETLTANFIILAAQTQAAYDEVLSQWRDRNYERWRRGAKTQNDEELVVALAAEALRRGTYRAAMAEVSTVFLNGTRRTQDSAVYLGKVEQGFRSLDTADKEEITRVTAAVSGGTLGFLAEPHVVEYLAVRGQTALLDSCAALARSLAALPGEPEGAGEGVMTAELIPGLLEAWADWEIWRSGEGTDNPFEPYLEAARNLVASSLVLTPGGERVFSFTADRAGMEANLRLGRALMEWAAVAENATDAASEAEALPAEKLWMGIGRSLVLSVLSLEDSAGSVPLGVVLSADGEAVEETGAQRLTSARIYRVLYPEEYAPRALPVRASTAGIWAWTAAQSVSTSQQGNVLDIVVSFPVGETHYMIIRGLGTFSKIQIYDQDYRTDPQFERYDSPGWRYFPTDRTLLLKMRHKVQNEHVRIYF